MNEKKFFGFSKVQIGSNGVNISDLEKTVADAFDHPEYCGGIAEVYKCLWNGRNSISFEKLISNAKEMGNSAVIKRQ